jgi:cell division protein FtsL
MLRYNGNTETLDLNLFSTSERDRAEKAKKHRERTIANKDPNDISSRRGSWMAITFMALFVLGALCVYIYGDIELNRYNSESMAVSQRIEEARRENSRLRAELSSMATPSRIEEFAAANGLVREHISQITHIHINIESVVEVAQREELSFFGRISNGFHDILAFLGFV